ncbi:hypothetical protein NXV13_04405 [Bacteroides ovatus]|nr:hypothetical protein [Bacteroides ovatus]
MNFRKLQLYYYGTQKKETLTGAISAVNNEALIRSPNASVVIRWRSDYRTFIRSD